MTRTRPLLPPTAAGPQANHRQAMRGSEIAALKATSFALNPIVSIYCIVRYTLHYVQMIPWYFGMRIGGDKRWLLYHNGRCKGSYRC
ncbi:hypothetical protein IWW34DRAFT_639964 [Fusarium oxysporum f. sp. albedinis]|nr:hypothetical protein IWW34DRAFT_639964 [Fusarium oxysporum f. sp. albedinis]